MFSNIGGKLKKLAKVFMWAGIVLSIIYGAFVIAGLPIGEGMENIGKGANVVSGIITMIAGAVISWISSWSIYALGQIATDVRSMADKNK